MNKLNINVINLKYSSERRKIFLNENKHLKFKFFNAIDGNNLSKKYIDSLKLFENNLTYTLGALGNSLSHLKLWEESIRKNKILTIAEDDAIFRNDFNVQYNKKIKSLPKNWDIILWGWNFDSYLSIKIIPDISPVLMLFDQNKMKNSINNFKKEKNNVNIFNLDKCFGIFSYTISPKGAKKLKSLCFPITNFLFSFPLLNKKIQNKTLDSVMNKFYNSLNSYICFPPLCITKNEHNNSTIRCWEAKSI
jgi:GR25 family glycosyltransferase involved in LPS biosynthesis